MKNWNFPNFFNFVRMYFLYKKSIQIQSYLKLSPTNKKTH